MNKEIIKEFFLKELMINKSINIIEIEYYFHDKTEFLYSNQIEKKYSNYNGYLIKYLEKIGGMGFNGNYFISTSDIRKYQLSKIV